MEFCVLVVREAFEEGEEMKKKFLFSYSLELLDHRDYYITLSGLLLWDVTRI